MEHVKEAYNASIAIGLGIQRKLVPKMKTHMHVELHDHSKFMKVNCSFKLSLPEKVMNFPQIALAKSL